MSGGGSTFEGTSSARPRTSTRRSTDGPQPESQSPHTRNLYDIPIPPLSGAIRAAGRTFSFGGRFSKASAPTPPPQPSTPGPSRSRGMTTSTSSTATPPKLPDTELRIGKIDDDFQNMFGDIGKRYYGSKDSSLDQPVDLVRWIFLFCVQYLNTMPSLLHRQAGEAMQRQAKFYCRTHPDLLADQMPCLERTRGSHALPPLILTVQGRLSHHHTLGIADIRRRAF